MLRWESVPPFCRYPGVLLQRPRLPRILLLASLLAVVLVSAGELALWA
ncbi:MAG: hypothetical protein ACR2OG_06905 [Gemmatimonadaceae bacterium]